MIAHAKFLNGQVYPLSHDDEEKFKQMFPDGHIVLTSRNCPELKAAIEKSSDELLAEYREVYEELARFD